MLWRRVTLSSCILQLGLLGHRGNLWRRMGLGLLGVLLDVGGLLSTCRLHIHAEGGLLLAARVDAESGLLLVEVGGLLHIGVVLLGELLLLVRQVIVQI